MILAKKRWNTAEKWSQENIYIIIIVLTEIIPENYVIFNKGN